MDEFGETPSIYVWPLGHVEGEPFPNDFYKRLAHAMEDHGFGWESI